MQEVQHLVLRRPPNPLPSGLVEALHQALLDPPHVLRVAANLNRALALLHDGQTPDLFFLGDLIPQFERRRVGPPRILEAENRVEPHFVEQPQRRLQVLLALAGKPHDDIGRDRNRPARGLHPGNPLQVFLARVQPAHGFEHARRA